MSGVASPELRITAIETVQLPQYQNILWLRLHTDAGLIGLGETFRGADAVATYLHTEGARALLGANLLEIDGISKLMVEPTSVSARRRSRAPAQIVGRVGGSEGARSHGSLDDDGGPR